MSRRASIHVRALAVLLLAGAACSAAAAARVPVPSPVAPTAESPAGETRQRPGASTRVVRILLAERQREVRIGAAGSWRIYGADGRTVVALPEPGERWVIERERSRLVARRDDSRPVTAREAMLVVRPSDGNGTIDFNGRQWRGELLLSVTSDGLAVINRVAVDEYLRGVVPLEIGTSAMGDLAAAQAQAVTARSYAITHLSTTRAFDMRATVQDQVYGGASAETPLGNRAVESTSGLVLLYAGRPVNAPYHATCGGSTAEPQDVWRSGAEPHLTRVSDVVPGSSRFYCDAAPRYRWTRTFTREDLRQSVARYIRTLSGGNATIGVVRAVRVTAVTPAGRVGALTMDTDRGPHVLRGNEIREALRLPSGGILYSTYFSVETDAGPNGVDLLTLRGGGNGHGVGMCQAGAIGRARAGQDFRTILRTYYSGTTVGFIE